MIMTTPGQTVGVSVFLDKIIADLGVSRAAVSLLYTLGTLAGSFSLPFVGRFIDWRGPRVAVVIIAALFALACVWMGFVGSLAGLLVGFVLIRGLGQGALGLVSIHVINIWFVRRRGLSVGLAGVGVALATAFFPSLIEGLIGAFGWRGAYMMLGALVAVTILPVGALLFRGHPERYGLVPDGRAERDAPAEAVFTAAEARRTVTFWLFALGGFSVAALSTGLIFHHYSIMAAGGLDRVAAATVFIPFGFVAAGANLTTGFLMDRLPPRFLLSTSLAFLCAALALATHVSSPAIILAYGGLLGLVQGMSSAVQASRLRTLFRAQAYRLDQGLHRDGNGCRDLVRTAALRAGRGCVRGLRLRFAPFGAPSLGDCAGRALRPASAGGAALSVYVDAGRPR